MLNIKKIIDDMEINQIQLSGDIKSNPKEFNVTVFEHLYSKYIDNPNKYKDFAVVVGIK